VRAWNDCAATITGRADFNLVVPAIVSDPSSYWMPGGGHVYMWNLDVKHLRAILHWFRRARGERMQLLFASVYDAVKGKIVHAS
jgi:hypothetical protein